MSRATHEAGYTLDSARTQVTGESGNAQASSRLRRFRETVNHPYIARLMGWWIFLIASVIAMRVLWDSHRVWVNPVGHALLEVCGALIASGIAYSLWVQYAVTTRRKFLLGTIAASGIGLGALSHALSSVITLSGWHGIRDAGDEYSLAWQITAGLLLLAASRTDAKEGRPNCRKHGLRWIGFSLLLSLGIAFLVGWLANSRLRAQDIFAPQFVHPAKMIFGWMTSPIAYCGVAVAVFVWALMVFVKRYIGDESALSDGIARCLVVASTAGFAGFLAERSYDLFWWMYHSFAVLALFVLLIELQREFGVSYADAQSRIEHLEAVHRISSQLGNTLDLRVVLIVLASDVADMLGARFASVMLVDDSGETLKTVATHGLPESPLKPAEPQRIEGEGRPGFHTGHAARAFREKRVCVVDDVFTDVEFVPWRILAKCDGYAVSVPLVYQDVALGVINLFFDSHVPLNDERVRLFETLASSAAVSIANAQLYDRALEAHPSETVTADLFRLRLAS